MKLNYPLISFEKNDMILDFIKWLFNNNFLLSNNSDWDIVVNITFENFNKAMTISNYEFSDFEASIFLDFEYIVKLIEKSNVEIDNINITLTKDIESLPYYY